VTDEEYKEVEELASRMDLSVSELVKRAILDLRKLKEEAYEKGFEDGSEFIIRDVERLGPVMFFGIEEFTVPCRVCGKPILFTNRDKELWEKEVKPSLQRAFSDWTHERCEGHG